MPRLGGDRRGRAPGKWPAGRVSVALVACGGKVTGGEVATLTGGDAGAAGEAGASQTADCPAPRPITNAEYRYPFTPPGARRVNAEGQAA
ncbi:MAG: hypothetical protein JW751_12485 [Polyangiaceae bacterium]|nr:hypothetical protein [Polyangiaceae bacterium]